MNPKIMVVDDEAPIRSLLATVLAKASYDVTEISDASALRESFQGPEPDVILLDLKLPDADGLELLPQVKKQWPQTEVIILTGFATIDAAVNATKLGAYDFQKKPFDHKSLLLSVERALEHKQLKEQTNSLRQALSTMSNGASPIFQSPAMKNIVRTVERVAPSDVSILITGESGTGKEVIADLIHTLSPRAKGPFIKINCAALPRELIESELFGSVKGAFTGAQSDREGLFKQASGGTLLMDELAEMPVDTQTKLLRVLQEKEFRPVGGRTSYKSDCRIIASTNLEVEVAIRSGKLREDLYYRISAISLALPPIRERREDILPLATSFLKRFAAQAARTINGFTPAAAEKLKRYDWPGNVRQLQNEIQRAVLMTEQAVIDVGDLSIVDPSTAAQDETDLTLLEGMERNTIAQMLKETGGNKLETAKRLGIGRQTLYNKIKAYGIEA
ncbi:MAG: sigma-54-dependent Fis family transcriptional regulator [Verrucomicrobiales bacterium]|nr:sigma-54-dependent Fis family transcriptional regulator [Verrucomicrobiales bacterium]